MKRKEYAKIEDFLEDASFSNWVLNKSLADSEFWDEWIKEHPESIELVNDAKSVLLGIQFKKHSVGPEKLNAEWQKLEAKISQTIEPKVKKVNFLLNKKLIGIAATIALLITSVIYFTKNPSTIYHKTSFGEILTLELPDGTDVTLNSNSTLSYKESNPRVVKLKGEAFFRVLKKPNTNSKFWVNTNDLQVEVFGTEFNVNSRNKKTQVFLQEGAVQLKLKNGNEKKMIPGDLISYSFSSNSILLEKRALRPELEISWKDGSLIFDRSPLIEAMHKIEENYGLTAIFDDAEIENILLTGAVPTKNIDICIQTIEKSAQVSIVKKGTKLYISKN